MIEEAGQSVSIVGDQQPRWRVAGIIFFGLLSLLLLYAAFMIIWPFMTAILLGAIVVILTFNLYRRLRERMHGRSTRAALTMLLGVTVVIVIPAMILGIMLVQQANVVIEKLQSGEAQAMVKRIDVTRHLTIIRRVAPNFDPASLSPERILLPAMRQVPGWVARHGGTLIGGLAGALLGFALVLLSMFFF
jgi:predicted PurR-regulated permease PerM